VQNVPRAVECRLYNETGDSFVGLFRQSVSWQHALTLTDSSSLVCRSKSNVFPYSINKHLAQSWSLSFGYHSAGDSVINLAVGCHYFLSGRGYLPSQRASLIFRAVKRLIFLIALLTALFF